MASEKSTHPLADATLVSQNSRWFWCPARAVSGALRREGGVLFLFPQNTPPELLFHGAGFGRHPAPHARGPDSSLAAHCRVTDSPVRAARDAWLAENTLLFIFFRIAQYPQVACAHLCLSPRLMGINDRDENPSDSGKTPRRVATQPWDYRRRDLYAFLMPLLNMIWLQRGALSPTASRSPTPTMLLYVHPICSRFPESRGSARAPVVEFLGLPLLLGSSPNYGVHIHERMYPGPRVHMYKACSRQAIAK